MTIKSRLPLKSSSGFYIVNRRANAVYWGAWREWYHFELGKNFFPDTMTVLYEFPPQIEELADHVAKWINDIRAKPDNARGKGGVINPDRVPEHPGPWTKWSPEKMEQFEAEEAERFA